MPTETHHYGQDHALQTVTVTTLDTQVDKGYWLIFIHGGAWRDPTQTSINYLNPTASILTNSPTYSSAARRITAFASIEYRLSPHPSHPQDPQSTDPKECRTAKHPDHINDVQAALAFLQKKYGFGERYVLIGHSCGATLAFQSVMGAFGAGFPGPVAVLGTAGVYDLKLLRDTHREISAYREIVEGAFGTDEAGWDAVSPAVVEGVNGVADGWKSGRLAVLAYSANDSLVDPEQREVMKASLGPWVKSRPGRRVEMFSLQGDHDDCWEKSEELVKAIAFTLQELQTDA
ncbi:Alpha/Beta hydrolase protein [Aspergillus avenaceus]|uniref:Kynurenine formamidase n=1 Tax=Aspergillus avenaceus TaxID=36643 RepID=A0A5N6U0W9_ASPAV|nr:Alpha/Beta hydrolase protein [Aspergillus avenaceus]